MLPSCDAQDLYHGFNQDDDSSIFVFIAIFASAQLLLSQLPTMRHLRHLNVAAVVCTAVFVVIVTVECITDGELPLDLLSHQVAQQVHGSCSNVNSMLLLGCGVGHADTGAPAAGMRLDRSSVHHGLVPDQSAGQYTMEVRGPPHSVSDEQSAHIGRGFHGGCDHLYPTVCGCGGPNDTLAPASSQAFEAIGIMAYAYSNPIMPGASHALALTQCPLDSSPLPFTTLLNELFGMQRYSR
jgi:hypothetical protein